MDIHCLDPDGVNEHESKANVILSEALPRTWKAYSALQTSGRKDQQAEFDLIIITADRIIVAELKDYDGKLFAKDGKWVVQINQYQGTRGNGVRQSIRASKILNTLITNKLRNKLSMIPFVESCVVLTGEATPENLPPDEKEKVFTLEEFKKIGHPKKMHKAFGGTWKNQTPKHDKDRPNKNIHIWDKFFINDSGNFKPRIFTHSGYAIEGAPFFKHREGIYSEYKSFQTNDKNYQAVMRRWDFNQSSITNYSRTAEERAIILRRESKVLSFIDSEDEELIEAHLDFIPSGESIDDIELYKYPRNKIRLEEYISNKWSKLSKTDKIELITVFLSHFARLHKIDVAHQDIGLHSIWISKSSLSITISNFLAASFPGDKNIKSSLSLTNLLAHNKIKLPEGFKEDSETSFNRDVFLAGSIAHYFAFGKWPHKLENDVYHWQPVDNDIFSGSLNSWFEKSLNHDTSEGFSNLIIALDQFISSESSNEANNSEQLDELNKFSSSTNFYVEYPQQIREPVGTSLFHGSNDGKVAAKIWNGISSQNSDTSVNLYLLSYLNKIQTLKNSKIDAIPEIVDFGYNYSFHALFVAFRWIEGSDWDSFILEQSEESALELILTLLKSLSQLHKNNLTHGHIHPKNIICNNKSLEIKTQFVDLFEYKYENESIKYADYLPEEYSDIPQIALDRYAVIKIIFEAAETLTIENLENYCSELLNQTEITEMDFNRLIDNFDNILDPSLEEKDYKDFIIQSRNFPPGLTEMSSDNGDYYISTRMDDNDTLRVFLGGQREQITIKINMSSEDIGIAFKPKATSHSELMVSKRRSEITLSGKISLGHNNNHTAVDFSKEILSNPIVQRKVLEFKNAQIPPDERITSNLDLAIPIGKIWSDMVETEYAMNPRVFLTSDPLEHEELKNIYSFSYLNEGVPIDFDLQKESVTLKRETGDYLKHCGFLTNISKGYLEFRNIKFNELQNGDNVFLISNLAESSRKKRKDAIDSIINNRAVITDLISYFDKNEDCQPDDLINISPSDEDIDSYAEENPDGEDFKFNDSQVEAFKKLHQFGPLGLLQGPPGTGKTAFIGAFIHYSIQKGSKKILLVSQSHEAVNNAAEKVRGIFQTKKQNVSIIRLGDENHISESLQDISEQSLQQNYKELFRAEIKHRITLASNSLSLPIEFIEMSIDFELSFGRNINTYSRIDPNKDLSNWFSKLTNFFLRKFNYESNFTHNNLGHIHKTFYELAERKFNIDSPLNIMKFRNIINLAFEWVEVMSSSKSQFQNFLVKTRTVVCGTCVGIARLHYGINENIYDLVVIDEASRASSSELAIAMSIGRKIVLVGDHKQLPPQYDPDHIKAVSDKTGINDLELKTSDFERSFLSSYGRKIGLTLSTQYRMAPAIGDLISTCFYDSMLNTGRGDAIESVNNLDDELGSTVTWYDTSNANSYERKPRGKNRNLNSWENEYEANTIIGLIKRISEVKELSDFLKPTETPQIGVICMYKEQVKLIREKLMRIQWLRNLEDDGVLKIDTVDSYQGKENSIIIVSLVRNNENLNVGFLKHESRINVALSRAKERLYVIGSTKMWSTKNNALPLGKVFTHIHNNESDEYSIIDSRMLET